jgi:hypothetical protein
MPRHKTHPESPYYRDLANAILCGNSRKHLGFQKLRKSIAHYVWNKRPGTQGKGRDRISIWNVFRRSLGWTAAVIDCNSNERLDFAAGEQFR